MDDKVLLATGSLPVFSHGDDTSPRVEHIRFAHWMIDAARPRVFVQLGTPADESYGGFCQAVHRSALGTRCYAVEGWTAPVPLAPGGDGPHGLSFDNSHFRSFSRILQAGQEGALSSLADGSIDLLRVRERWSADVAVSAFEAWLPKMSERGLVLLERDLAGGDEAADRFFRDVAERFPMFEFPHGGGPVLVGVGVLIPEGLKGRLASGEIVPIRRRAGAGDAGPGERRIDRRPSPEWDRRPDDPSFDLEVLEAELLRPARGDGRRAGRADAAQWDLRDQQRKVARLLLENASLQEARGILADQLHHVERSFGWVLIQRLRRVRSRLLRDGTIRGRGWSLLARFLKTAPTSGTSVAVLKSLDKVARKLGRPAAGEPHAACTAPPRVRLREVPADRFQELPWRSLGDRPGGPSRRRGHLPVLLVSHSACRTGAALCFLRLAEELRDARNSTVGSCSSRGANWRIPSRGSPPPLRSTPWWPGASPGTRSSAWSRTPSASIRAAGWRSATRWPSTASTRPSPSGRSRCSPGSTSCPRSSRCSAACAAIKAIKAASRMLLVPSEFVRDAWISRFGIRPDRIRTVSYGIDSRSAGCRRRSSGARSGRSWGCRPTRGSSWAAAPSTCGRGRPLRQRGEAGADRPPRRQPGRPYLVRLGGPGDRPGPRAVVAA